MISASAASTAICSANRSRGPVHQLELLDQQLGEPLGDDRVVVALGVEQVQVDHVAEVQRAEARARCGAW